MASIDEALSVLQDMVQNPDPNVDFNWGAELYSIASDSSVSSPHDDINNETYPDIPTPDLIDFAIELKNFKTVYQQPSQLLPVIEAAFLDIIAHPNERRLGLGGFYYSTLVNGITVTIRLEPSDMSLSPASYLSQVSLVF